MAETTQPGPAALPRTPLATDGPLARAFAARGLHRFDTAAAHVHGLPYGRSSDVLAEARGTCSSKHALLARLGAEQGLDVVLMLGLVRMDGPDAVRAVLQAAGLDWMPEAHCWLRVEGIDWDLTFPEVTPGPPVLAVLESTPWSPALLSDKPAWHRERMAHHLPRGWTLPRMWRVREDCIAALAGADASPGATAPARSSPRCT